MLARACLIMAALSFAAVSVSIADTWTVRLDGTGDFMAIQPALDAAAVGDTVIVVDGTYYGDGNRDLSFGGKDLVVMSESDDPASCVIDCEGGPGDEHRGFVFESTETGAAVLRGFTVRGGWVSEWGGGILCQSATTDSLPAPRIERCLLTENTAGQGGGLAVLRRSVPYILDCRIERNTGGGAHWGTGDNWYGDSGASIVEDSDFDQNIGPGISTGGTDQYPLRRFVLRRCSISENTETGLALGNPHGGLLADHCTMARNGGWGVYLPWPDGPNSRTPYISWQALLSCFILENAGGGVDIASDQATLVDCTISYNGGPGVRDWISNILEIWDCHVEHNEEYGVRIHEGGITTFDNNTIRHNGGYGVSIWMPWPAIGIMTNNVVTDNGGPGLILENNEYYYTDPIGLRSWLLADNSGSGVVFSGTTMPGPLEIIGCTITGNDLHGFESQINVDLRIVESIIAFNAQQAAAGPLESSSDLTCTNLYANAAGNYTGPLAPFLGIQGNISAAPMFCSPDYTIHAASPCAPGNHPDGADCGLIGALGVGCDGPTSVLTPRATALLGNAPNPFNPSTTISLTLAHPDRVTLTIHDLAGRRLRSLLAAEPLPAGPHTIEWRARDDRGYPVPSGVYLYRLQTGTVTETRRMALIR